MLLSSRTCHGMMKDAWLLEAKKAKKRRQAKPWVVYLPCRQARLLSASILIYLRKCLRNFAGRYGSQPVGAIRGQEPRPSSMLWTGLTVTTRR